MRMYFDRVTLLLSMLKETEEERLADARCQGDSHAEDIFTPPDTNGALPADPKGQFYCYARTVAYIVDSRS